MIHRWTAVVPLRNDQKMPWRCCEWFYVFPFYCKVEIKITLGRMDAHDVRLHWILVVDHCVLLKPAQRNGKASNEGVFVCGFVKFNGEG